MLGRAAMMAVPFAPTANMARQERAVTTDTELGTLPRSPLGLRGELIGAQAFVGAPVSEPRWNGTAGR